MLLDRVDVADPVKSYNAYNLTQLREMAPYMDWPNYFSGFAPRVFPTPTIVRTPSYFSNLTNILEETDDAVLEAYFVWSTVRGLAKLLGPNEPARKEITHLSNYLSGIEEGVRPRREDVCLQSILDNYGFMIGRYYIQQAFSGRL